MQYMLLIYCDEGAEPTPGTKAFDDMMAEYFAFSDEVKARNVHRDGQALQPVSTATTVRVRNGRTLTTDGPFAETQEQLGGFYLLECEDLDAALEYAARIPTARYGSVEVRPVVALDAS